MNDSTASPAIRGFASRTAVVDGVQLHYWMGGDASGPPVLLWHGFLGTAYAWREVMVALADAGAAVLAPDMRGYGDSDKPPGTDGYDGRALAEEFRALVREVGFGAGRPLTLVAHDMGAPPALLWAADHPDEVERLFYAEVPVMLADVLAPKIAYTSQAAARSSMWWWLLPLAPGVPEALLVGNERDFLRWFYRGDERTTAALEPALEEYLRTFAGSDGVLGALGVYRAAFTTMEQTEPLTRDRVTVPIVAIGGEKSLADSVGAMVERVATDVQTVVVAGSGHFIPEEAPEELVRLVLEVLARDP